MSKTSAGILIFKKDPDLQVLLAHPGGPYWKNKDDGAWSIPKGLIEEDEDHQQAAVREFEEETGYLPKGTFIPLGSIRQKGGKVVYAWAVEDDLPDDFRLQSNEFDMEWPPKSGKKESFPEIDRVMFFNEIEARKKINPAQSAFIDRLKQSLKSEDSDNHSG